jgi:hypothetical protein
LIARQGDPEGARRAAPSNPSAGKPNNVIGVPRSKAHIERNCVQMPGHHSKIMLVICRLMIATIVKTR